MWALRWYDDALDRMAVVYVGLDADAQAQLAGAVEKLNARLKADPLAVGESRVGGYRLTFVPWLAVLFHVELATRTVTVTDAGPSGRR